VFSAGRGKEKEGGKWNGAPATAILAEKEEERLFAIANSRKGVRDAKISCIRGGGRRGVLHNRQAAVSWEKKGGEERRKQTLSVVTEVIGYQRVREGEETAMYGFLSLS